MAVIRTALIGAGVMGSNHARTLNNSTDFELSVVIDSDVARAKVLAEKYEAKYSTEVNDVLYCDAAVIATNTESHYQTSLPLLEAGLPLLIEKPLTMNLEETTYLCRQARETQTPLVCGFVERFNPAIAAAREVIQGPVVHLIATRHSPHPTRVTTGVIEDLLIHDLDLALTFFVPESTVKGVATCRPNLALHDEIAEVSMLGPLGELAHLSTSRWGQRKVRHWSLSTDTQTVEVDLLQQTVVAFENINQEVGPSGGASYRTRTVIDYPFIARSGEPLALQLAHFSRIVEDRSLIAAECDGIMKTHLALDSILKK